MLDGPVLKWDRVRQPGHAFTADRWNLPATKDLGGHKDNYLINDPACQGAESQIRPAFQKKALNFPLIQLGRQCFERSSKQYRIGECRYAASAVQNHAQQGTAPRPAAAVGELRLIGEDGSASGDERIVTMAQPVDHGARFL